MSAVYTSGKNNTGYEHKHRKTPELAVFYGVLLQRFDARKTGVIEEERAG